MLHRAFTPFGQRPSLDLVAHSSIVPFSVVSLAHRLSDRLAARSVAVPAADGARPGHHRGALNWVRNGAWASVLAEAAAGRLSAWRPAIRR